MRPAPFFVADNTGLDFLNSKAVPADTVVEWLASGEDLLAWLDQASLVPAGVLDEFRRHALPGELDAIAAQARSLRDWFKPFVTRHMGRPIEPRALRELEQLNEVLARDDEFGQIVIGHRVPRGPRQHERGKAGVSALAWRVERRWRGPGSLLFPIARSLADLVCMEDFTNVKACERPDCTLLFIDRTRGRVRRWCSMAVCGNRVKQAAHRRRSQHAQGDT